MESAESRFVEAQHLEDKGQLDEARAIYLELADETDQAAPALNRLGVIAARRGDTNAAQEYFNRCLAIDRDNASALSNLGNICFERGDLTRAESLYQMAIAADPKASRPHQNLAAVYKQKNDINGMAREMRTYHRLQRRELNHPRSRSGVISKPGCGTQIIVLGLAAAAIAVVVHLA